MNKRNKVMLCFFLVMLITLMSCCIVAATDNADYNTTTTTNTIEVNKNVQQKIQQNTIPETQSDDNTIEETDDQNAIKQENKTAKAKTINKVNNTQKVKTATNITGPMVISTSGEYVLTGDLALGSGRINVTANNVVIDGNDYTITRSAAGLAISVTGNNVTLKNIVFNNVSTTGASVSFSKNYTVENCTFINGKQTDTGGVITTADKSVGNISDTKFINSTVQYKNLIKVTGETSYVSVCQIYCDGVEIREDQVYCDKNHNIYSASKGNVVFLYMDVFNPIMNVTTTFDMHLLSQRFISVSAGAEARPLSRSVSYVIENATHSELNSSSGTTGADGIYSFSHKFEDKGLYYIHYNYVGNSTTRSVGGTKTVRIYESSSLSGVNLASVSTEDGVDVQITVKNSTGSNVESGSVIITINGVNYTGSIDDGIATVHLPKELIGGTYDTNITYTGDEEHFISSSSIEHTLDLARESTSLSMSSIGDVKVGESFTFNATLVDSHGVGIEGETVNVTINGVPIDGTYITDNNGNITVTYTPTSNATINITVEYAGSDDYSGSQNITNITGSSISLMDPVINVYMNGNASIDEEFIILVNVTAGDELLDSGNAYILKDANHIHIEGTENATYDNENKLWTIKLNASEVKVYQFEFDYNGLVGVVETATKQFDVSVNKIPTKTFVDYAEYDEETIILMVYFNDVHGNRINEGIFHVNMNNSEGERQDYNISNLEDPSYKWPVSYDADREAYLIVLDNKFYRTNGYPYSYVTYNGTNKYDKSSEYISEMEVKHDTYVRLNTYIDSDHTTPKDVFYINETVYIYLDIINHYGFLQNGRFNITIANKDSPESAFYRDDEHATNTGGYLYLGGNTTAGEYTITVNYKGSGGNNPSSATKTFTILKHESSTVARVINNTAGNVTLGVKVTGQNDLPIRNGKLTVEVNGVPKVVDFILSDDEDEIIVNLNDLNIGITTTSTVPITITYQGNTRYQSSVALDETTIGGGQTPAPLSSITADKGVTTINVDMDPESGVTIDNRFDVFGYLTEIDGTPITTSNLNITITDSEGNVLSSQNVSTRSNGYFSQNFTAALGEYDEGVYTVNVSYYDNNHNIVNVTKTFTVSKETSNVAVSVENTTAGNITLRVKVTDERGYPITEGKVNITDEEGNPLYTDVMVDGNGEAILTVTSVTSNADDFHYFVNYNGTGKYAPDTAQGSIEASDIITRNVTINASSSDDTYGDVKIKVNITDTTTGDAIQGLSFNITDNDDNVVGTGTTGADGTIIVTLTEDLPVGVNTLKVVIPDGNDTYTAKTSEFTVDIKKRQTSIDAEVTNTTAGNVTLKVTLTDPENSTRIISDGRIIITDNGVEVANQEFTGSTDGIVFVKTNITDSESSHNLVVRFTDSTYYADATFVDDEDKLVFDVEKRNSTLTINPTNRTIGNTSIEVTITDEDGTDKVVNATVNVYTDDTKSELIGTGVTNENGVADIPVNLTPGSTGYYVEYSGNTTYNAQNSTETISLEKRETSVNASLVNSTAGSVTVRVNVTDATTDESVNEGMIIIKDGDKVVATYPITENPGFIDVKTNITESGAHSLTVEYVGTDTYSDSSFTDAQDALSNIVVDKRNATVIYEVVNSTYNDTVIKVTLVDEDGVTPVSGGSVNVYLPGESQALSTNVTDSTGVTYIKVDVPVTATVLVVNYTGNTTYNENVTIQEITITPRAVNVNATVINKTAGNITVNVNVTDVDTGLNVTHGIINITSNGKVVASVNLTDIDENIATVNPDGTLTIYTNIEEALRYTLGVNYYGSPYYDDEVFQTESFTATYKESNLTADIPNKTKGNTTLYVNFTDFVTGEDITGVVYVSVDGAKKVEYQLAGGKLEELLDLPIGSHTVTVTYNGDNKYNESTATVEIIVLPRAISVGYEITNHTLGNVTINVTVNDTETQEGINGTVIVHVGDEEIPVTVVDGVGIAVLDIPITGEDVSVSYPADDTYKEVPQSTPEPVNVEPRQSSVKAEVVDNTTGQVTVRVNVTDTTTGNAVTNGRIIITDGETVVYNDTYTSADGIVDVITNITTSGIHKLNVTFTGNENYTDANYTDSNLENVAIENRTAVIAITPVNNTFNDIRINVTLTDTITGDVIVGGEIQVYLDGVTEPVGRGTTDENGTVTIKFDVPVDATQVTVKYLGNESNIDPYETTYNFSVEKREVNLNASVTNKTAGNVTVNVNITDKTTGEALTTGVINITDNKGNVVATVDLSTELDPNVAKIEEDGTLTVYTNVSKTGNYKLSVNYDGAPNYGSDSYNTELFTAEAKEAEITVTVPEESRIKGNTTVNVTLRDPVTGEKLNGTVTVYVNGTPVDTINVVNGEGGKPLDLPVGDSNVKVVFEGDEKYGPAEKETGTITVEPRAINVNATLTNSTVGNITLEVNVTDIETGVGVNGTVEVKLPNGTLVPVTVVNGTAVVVLDIPIDDTTGEQIQVRYPADGVNNETVVNTTNALSIGKRESSITAEPESTSANNTSIKVTLVDPVTGEPITSGRIIITDNGNPVANVTFDEESGVVIVPTNITTSGPHKLKVTFTDNANYSDANYTSEELSEITIANRTANITVTPNNSTFGNTTIDVTVVDSETGQPLPPGGKVEVFDSEGNPVGNGTIGDDGKVTIPITVPVNTTNVTVKYFGNDTSYDPVEVNYTGIQLDKRASNVVAEVTNTTAGNITVKVNVTDATNGTGITEGTVDITLNGEVVGTADLSKDLLPDGTVVIYTNITNVGNYALVAKYSGNENYTGANVNMEAFDAKTKESNLTAGVPNTTKGNTTLEVMLKDPVTGEKLNGTVYVIINGREPGRAYPVTDGVLDTSGLLDLPVGENTVKVVFDGDRTYNATETEIEITVEPRAINVNATLTNNTVGNITLEVNVTDNETGVGVNGTVEVTLPNGTIVPVTVVNGTAVVVLDIPINETNNKPLVVKYPADGEYNETVVNTTNALSIGKRDSSITAVPESTSANNTSIKVTLVDQVTGEPITSGRIIITDNGNPVANVTFDEESGVVIVPTNITTSGAHKLNVTFTDNANYSDANYTSEELSGITIANRTADISVTPNNSTFGNTTIDVTVVDSETGQPLPPGGKVEVFDSEGNPVGNGTIGDDGKVTIPITVPVNTTNVTVKYFGNDTSYDPVEVNYTGIQLDKRASNVVAEVTNTTAGNITVKVNVTDATNGTGITEGTVDITLNGEVVGTADLSKDLLPDGTVVIYTNITNVGNYALVAKYSGNENYTGANVNIKAFDAKTKESNLTASVPNTTKGNTTLEVLLKDPVTGEKLNGTVYVIINGQEPGRAYPVIDGVLNTSGLLDLSVGENTVKVVFDGDRTYNATDVEFNVTVEPRAINVNATLTNNTVGNITLEVNVTDNETGVGVNGTVEVTLPNGTIVPVEVVNGSAVVVLDIPINETNSQPLKVTFPADGEFNETVVNTTNSLSIEPRASKVEAIPGNVTAGNSTVDVVVTDPVTGEPVTEGEVIITLDGNEIGRQPVGPDGTVTVPVKLPERGNYTLEVAYKGSENFTDDTTTINNVEVLGRESKVVPEIVNRTQGNVTIKVDVVDQVTGEKLPVTSVNVTFPDGTTDEFPINENGTITVPLDVGINPIIISYPGNETFNGTEYELVVPVDERESSVLVEVTNATAGNTTVKVTVTDPVTGKPVTSGDVSITVNGEEIGRQPVGPNGTVSIPTNLTKSGSATIVATYEGNGIYSESSKETKPVTIMPKESKVTAELTDTTQGDTTLKVELVDPVTGEGLNGNVTINLPDATTITRPVKDGILEIPVDLPVGNSTLRVTYMGNETYDSIHYDLPVTVNQRPTSLTSNVVNSTAGNVSVGVKVVDTLTGEPLNTGRVLVMDGDKVVGTATLDENGEAVIKTDITKSDGYDLKVVYEADANHADNTTNIDNIKVTPRASNVTVNITNSTAGDTKVNITMVDPSTDKPINGEVIVTLPDGSNITATAENGNIVLPVDLPVGDNEIVITYPGNETYDDVVVKLPIKVSKRATNTAAKELTNTAGNVAVEVKVTDEATGEAINAGDVIISVGGKQVGKAPVKNGVAVVDTSIAKAGNYTLDVQYAGSRDYESSDTSLVENVGPRPVDVDVRVVNNTVQDTTFEVTVTDNITGAPVQGETVTVTLPNGTKVVVKTDAKGRAIIKAQPTSGNNNIRVAVDGNEVYDESVSVVNTTVEKVKVRVTVDGVIGTVGEKITLTAHVVDEYGKPVNGGNLVFKLNGRTLQTDGRFDTSTDKPMKLKVQNGIVTFTMTADLYLRAGKNITASYSGSYMYESAKGNVAEANIRKRTAEVTVTTSPRLVKQDKDVVFTAKISDITSDSSKSLVNDNDAYVIFKVNGKTLKDNKGNNIKVKVTNGMAKYTYHVPRGTSGMVDGHMRDYMVTAVYSNNDFYPDARDTVAYNVERSRTTINITSATVKNDQLSITANILDQYGKNVIGKNSISVKINGKTFKVDGKSLTYTVTNGKISLSGIKLAGNKVKSLTIITGERQSYYESQVTTKSVKTL